MRSSATSTAFGEPTDAGARCRKLSGLLQILLRKPVGVKPSHVLLSSQRPETRPQVRIVGRQGDVGRPLFLKMRQQTVFPMPDQFFVCWIGNGDGRDTDQGRLEILEGTLGVAKRAALQRDEVDVESRQFMGEIDVFDQRAPFHLRVGQQRQPAPADPPLCRKTSSEPPIKR